jgi:hypothetical protein
VDLGNSPRPPTTDLPFLKLLFLKLPFLKPPSPAVEFAEPAHLVSHAVLALAAVLALPARNAEDVVLNKLPILMMWISIIVLALNDCKFSILSPNT